MDNVPRASCLFSVYLIGRWQSSTHEVHFARTCLLAVKLRPASVKTQGKPSFFDAYNYVVSLVDCKLSGTFILVSMGGAL